MRRLTRKTCVHAILVTLLSLTAVVVIPATPAGAVTAQVSSESEFRGALTTLNDTAAGSDGAADSISLLNTITFAAGGDGDDDPVYSATDALTIEGNFYALDANSMHRILKIEPGAGPVTFRNVTLENGLAPDGADAGGLAATPGGSGGAILSDGVDVTLVSVTANLNAAGAGGNGNDTFGGSFGGDGGAVSVINGGVLMVSGSSFTSNSAGDGGSSPDATSAGGGGSGGALAGENVTVTSSSFTSNSTGEGGTRPTSSPGFAGIGGAISSTGTLTVNGVSTFTTNTAGADGAGGAISSSGGSITGATFTGNSVPDDTAEVSRDPNGGAIEISGPLMVIDSVFDGNSAGELGEAGTGGAIWASSATGTLEITGSTFTNNHAHMQGGAIHSSNLMVVSGSTFTANTTADHWGGAISQSEDGLTVRDSTFTSNVGGNRGGAIYVGSSGPLLVERSDFVTNTVATGGGGAIYTTIFTGVRVVDSLFDSNSAADGADGVGGGAGEAGGRGGAILTTGGPSPFEIERSTFVGNTAGNGGDSAPNDGDFGFQGGAGGSGGAISGGSPSVINSTFTQNAAGAGGAGGLGTVGSGPPGEDGQGGAIGYATGGVKSLVGFTVEAQATTFSANTAPGGGDNIQTDILEAGGVIVHDPTPGDSCLVGSTSSIAPNVESGTTCEFIAAGDLQSQGDAAINLQPLADNGGLTPTMAVAPSSVAIDLVPCTASPGFTDQTGRARPVGSACDAGAFEAPCTVTTTSAVQCELAGGEAAATAGGAADPANPVITTVQLGANGGTVVIDETGGGGAVDENGWFVIDHVDITAPAQSVADPLVLTFRIDSSAIPAPHDAFTLDILKDGAVVGDCTGAGAVPDPCVEVRFMDGDDAVIVVRTTTASTWSPVIADGACPAGLVPVSPFTDLDGSVHDPRIHCLRWWNITSGVTATTYVPKGTVTRAQMATFIANLIRNAGYGLPAGPDAFGDDDDSTHEGNINALAAAGVVRGIGAGNYAPELPVRRDQMASFLVQAHDYMVAVDLADGPDKFTDDETSVHEGNINKAAAAGLTSGKTPTTFDPFTDVSREQMATFLTNLLEHMIDNAETTLEPAKP